jgi:hypothetical protein
VVLVRKRTIPTERTFFYYYYYHHHHHHHHHHNHRRRHYWQTGQFTASTVTRLRGCITGESGFDSRQKQRLLVSSGFIPVPRHAQPIQFIPGDCSLGKKRLGSEGDHLSPSCVEIQYAWSYTSSPPYLFMAWSFIKGRDYFTIFGPISNW